MGWNELKAKTLDKNIIEKLDYQDAYDDDYTSSKGWNIYFELKDREEKLTKNDKINRAKEKQTR